MKCRCRRPHRLTDSNETVWRDLLYRVLERIGHIKLQAKAVHGSGRRLIVPERMYTIILLEGAKVLEEVSARTP